MCAAVGLWCVIGLLTFMFPEARLTFYPDMLMPSLYPIAYYFPHGYPPGDDQGHQGR